MSQSIGFDRPCEDTKYSIDIKEEPLDANSGTVIDNIKPDSPCSNIKDEIYIKEDPLESIDECELNVELRSSDPLEPNSSNLQVCGIHYFLAFNWYTSMDALVDVQLSYYIIICVWGFI